MTKKEFILSKNVISEPSEIGQLLRQLRDIDGDGLDQYPYLQELVTYPGLLYVKKWGDEYHLTLDEVSFSSRHLEDMENTLWFYFDKYINEHD